VRAAARSTAIVDVIKQENREKWAAAHHGSAGEQGEVDEDTVQRNKSTHLGMAVTEQTPARRT
jgi:hypothetical protein